MKMSTKGRYALRFMIDLASHINDGHHVAMKDVSKRQKISFKYLWLVIHPLISRGLIESIRGAGGGYRLAKKPSEITVYDIITAVEGDLYFVDCVSEKYRCNMKTNCLARRVWMGASDVLSNYFKSITLADIINKWQTKLAIPEI